MLHEKNEIRLYNMILPIWLLVWVPGWWWLLLIPANFAIDYFVLKWRLNRNLIAETKPLLKKYSWRTCLYGFLSDFIGALLLLTVFGAASYIGADMIDTGDHDKGIALSKWAGNAMLSAWSSPSAFLITLAGVAIAALLIYVFNFRMLRKNPEIGTDAAKDCAKWLTILTAPYLFLLPFTLGG